MTRQKMILLGGIPILTILLVGGGFAAGQKGLFGKASDIDKSIDSIESSTTSLVPPTNSGIPLGGQQAESESSGGLSVSSPTGSTSASNLGQLDQSGSQSSGAGSGSGSNSSGGSGGINPAGFKDYEKYKDQSHALFGEIIKGTGTELVMNKQAAIYYKGWLTNGQMFDQSPVNSSGQKQPLIFSPGAQKVVPGMEEGVLGMKVGGKRLIIIPPAVGYGDKGYGPVPANSVMIFEVELVTVQ